MRIRTIFFLKKEKENIQSALSFWQFCEHVNYLFFARSAGLSHLFQSTKKNKINSKKTNIQTNHTKIINIKMCDYCEIFYT